MTLLRTVIVISCIYFCCPFNCSAFSVILLPPFEVTREGVESICLLIYPHCLAQYIARSKNLKIFHYNTNQLKSKKPVNLHHTTTLHLTGIASKASFSAAALIQPGRWRKFYGRYLICFWITEESKVSDLDQQRLLGMRLYHRQKQNQNKNKNKPPKQNNNNKNPKKQKTNFIVGT